MLISAGTYPYTDTANTAAATIKVPMTAAPTSGTTTTTFTITWAAATPPPGYTYDVQIKRPTGMCHSAAPRRQVTRPS